LKKKDGKEKSYRKGFGRSVERCRGERAIRGKESFCRWVFREEKIEKTFVEVRVNENMSYYGWGESQIV